VSELGDGLVASSNADARMNWVREMAASVENDVHHSVSARERARTGLEVLATAFGITFTRRDHPRSLTFDNALQGELQKLKASTDRLRTMYGWNKELPSRPSNIVPGEFISALDKFSEALAAANLLEPNVQRNVGSLIREVDGGVVENLPSDRAGQEVQVFDEELAGRLLSESMDRLTIVARDVSDLAAETAIDLALIKTKRVQIDRAQAENWALLRELTEQAQ